MASNHSLGIVYRDVPVSLCGRDIALDGIADDVMTGRPPAQVCPLGEFLFDEMIARGWTTADVAKLMPGNPATNQMTVDLILAVPKDGLLIDDQTFDALADVFRVNRLFFRRLDAQWRRWPDRRALFIAPRCIFEPRLA